jgi:hypothetical protein
MTRPKKLRFTQNHYHGLANAITVAYDDCSRPDSKRSYRASGKALDRLVQFARSADEMVDLVNRVLHTMPYPDECECDDDAQTTCDWHRLLFELQKSYLKTASKR